MSVSLRSDVSGTYGAIQLNGVDKLTLNADGTVSSATSPTTNDNTTKLATTAFTQTTVAAAVNAGVASTVGMKNRIINGDARVVQRATATFANNVFGYSGPDRFLAANTAAGGSFTQSAGTLVDNGVTKPCVTQTVTGIVADLSTNKYWTGITQSIEGYNCYDLVGKQVAISFLFRASVAGTYCVAMRDAGIGAGATYSYVTSFTVAANTVTKIVVNVPTIPLGANMPATNGRGCEVWIGAQNSGVYTTTNANVWQAGNFFALGSHTQWGTTNGASISVAELQLEVGSQATAFEYRSIGTELALCQRYFYSFNPFAMQVSGATTSYITFRPHPVQMRTTPAINHNFTDANYVATGPTGLQWNLVLTNVAYASKSSGTFNFTVSGDATMMYINFAGATLSGAVNQLLTGTGVNVVVNAEI
jgi:hypothetical protein